MAKAKGSQIVTANDLLSGDVVYLTEDGGWSGVHAEAAVAHSAEAAQDLLERGAAQSGRVVGAYLAAATLDATGRPQPLHYREVIRTRGPTIRPDLGKQAETQGSVAPPAA